MLMLILQTCLKLLASATLLYVIARFTKWCINRRIVNNIPGPRPHFITGNINDFIGTPEVAFKKVRLLASKFKFYRVWMGHISAINIYQPEDIEVVVSSMKNNTKSRIYMPLVGWLKTGLLTSSGQKWHDRRKILTPAFHFNILQQFADILSQQADHLTKKLSNKCDEPHVDIVPYISEFTLNSITETAMGTRIEQNNVKQMAYKKSMYEFNKLVVYRVLRPWLYFNITWMFDPASWYERKLIKTMQQFTDSVINERKKTFAGSITSKIDDAQYIAKRKLAMLDLLLSAKADGFPIDDEGIREEVDTFTFEGFDTTSMAITFTLMLLAYHTDIQQKVYEEVLNTLELSSKVQLSQLQGLKYLEMCIKESLRMYPPVPFISRLAGEDLLMPKGYKIPYNTHIHIHIYDLHHDSGVYPDPEKFDPDRFLPENVAKRHPFAYLPFSGGPRNCIGQKFALMELKIVISAILRKFQLIAVDTPAEKILEQEIVLRPKNGVRIKLLPRKR